MKRIISILMVALMLFGLCSCEFFPIGRGKKVALVLNENEATLTVGEKLTLLDNPLEKLDWSSSNEAVAVVNSEGVVTAVSEGIANITCTAKSNAQASCTVTVKKAEQKEQSAQNAQSSSSDFIFPDSSVRKLTEGEISQKLKELTGTYSPSGKYAQDAINEIYARHGYKFQTEKIYNYYASKSWYTPSNYFNESRFTEIEKYNIELFGKFK